MATGSGLSVEVGSSILGGIATIGKTTSTATTPPGEVGPAVGVRWLDWPEKGELDELDSKQVSEDF